MTLLFELTFLLVAIFEGIYFIKAERSFAKIVTYTKMKSITVWGKRYENQYRLRIDRKFFKVLRNSNNILLIEDIELRRLLMGTQYEIKMQVYGMVIGFIALGTIIFVSNI